MDIDEIFKNARELLTQRGVNYGGIEENFSRSAQIASLKLDKTITPYEVAIVLESVKDARRAVSPDHFDSHVDGINYRVFATMLSGALPNVSTTREMAVALSNIRKKGVSENA